RLWPQQPVGIGDNSQPHSGVNPSLDTPPAHHLPALPASSPPTCRHLARFPLRPKLLLHRSGLPPAVLPRFRHRPQGPPEAPVYRPIVRPSWLPVRAFRRPPHPPSSRALESAS